MFGFSICSNSESEIEFRVSYRLVMHPAFAPNTIVESHGRLIVQYDAVGNPTPTLIATLLRPRPGDVEGDEYPDNNIGMTNHGVAVTGTVIAVPPRS